MRRLREAPERIISAERGIQPLARPALLPHFQNPCNAAGGGAHEVRADVVHEEPERTAAKEDAPEHIREPGGFHEVGDERAELPVRNARSGARERERPEDEEGEHVLEGGVHVREQRLHERYRL